MQASNGFKKPQRLAESRAGMGRLKKDFKEILQGLTGKTNKWADEWKSPNVLQDIAPSSSSSLSSTSLSLPCVAVFSLLKGDAGHGIRTDDFRLGAPALHGAPPSHNELDSSGPSHDLSEF